MVRMMIGSALLSGALLLSAPCKADPPAGSRALAQTSPPTARDLGPAGRVAAERAAEARPEWPAQPLATVIAAFIAVSGVALTLGANRRREQGEQRRQARTLQASLVADIRAILRVLDVATVVDQLIVMCLMPAVGMRIGPARTAEDYFLLYDAVARDLGLVDETLARRTSAFYVLLKGSRDLARAVDALTEAAGAGQDQVRDGARKVLRTLEHVYRNGLLAVSAAHWLGPRDAAPPPGTAPDLWEQAFAATSPEAMADPFFADMLAAWLAIVAIQAVLDEAPPNAPIDEAALGQAMLRATDADSPARRTIDFTLRESRNDRHRGPQSDGAPPIRLRTRQTEPAAGTPPDPTADFRARAFAIWAARIAVVAARREPDGRATNPAVSARRSATRRRARTRR